MHCEACVDQITAELVDMFTLVLLQLLLLHFTRWVGADPLYDCHPSQETFLGREESKTLQLMTPFPFFGDQYLAASVSLRD